MKKLLVLGLALTSLVCSAQLKGNKAYDRRYYGHWETNVPLQDNIQLIIYNFIVWLLVGILGNPMRQRT